MARFIGISDEKKTESDDNDPYSVSQDQIKLMCRVRILACYGSSIEYKVEDLSEKNISEIQTRIRAVRIYMERLLYGLWKITCKKSVNSTSKYSQEKTDKITKHDPDEVVCGFDGCKMSAEPDPPTIAFSRVKQTIKVERLL